MRDRLVSRERDHDEVLLCCADCLIDSERSVSTLAETDADATFAVTDDDRNAEGETATTSHDAGNATHVERSLIEFTALAWSAFATRTAGATSRPTWTTALTDSGLWSCRFCGRSNNRSLYNLNRCSSLNNLRCCCRFGIHKSSRIGHKSLKGKTLFAGSVSKRLHLSLVTESSAVEDYRRDTCRLCLLRKLSADGNCLYGQ